jgi:hypothetical protein
LYVLGERQAPARGTPVGGISAGGIQWEGYQREGHQWEGYSERRINKRESLSDDYKFQKKIQSPKKMYKIFAGNPPILRF